MPQPILETPRLILREFAPGDAPTVAELAGAWEVADTTFNIPHPYSLGDAESFISSRPQLIERGEAAVFAIVLREGSRLCGCISLILQPRFARAEMGYWIGVPTWNQGICTEAGRAVLRYGFRDLGLHRIHACHIARNPASGRVMQKLGMSYEGCQRQHIRKHEVYEDLVLYGLLRADWEQMGG